MPNQDDGSRRFHIYDEHDGSEEDFLNIINDYELLSEYCQRVVDIIDNQLPIVHQKIKEADEHMQKFKEYMDEYYKIWVNPKK